LLDLFDEAHERIIRRCKCIGLPSPVAFVVTTPSSWARPDSGARLSLHRGAQFQ
jgi:hypothetical protein